MTPAVCLEKDNVKGCSCNESVSLQLPRFNFFLLCPTRRKTFLILQGPAELLFLYLELKTGRGVDIVIESVIERCPVEDG